VDKVLKTITNRLYCDPARPSAFSTLRKLRSATAKKKRTSTTGKSDDNIRASLEKQDAYTLQRPVRKRFARNPYNVTNVMDVWECDLLDVQAHAKYNDNHSYILCYRCIPTHGPRKYEERSFRCLGIWSIFDDPKYSSRRPILVRIVKAKEFLNKHFRGMFRDEGVQFQVCKNPYL